MTFTQIAAPAVIIPLVSLAVVASARWLGRWLRQAITETVTDGIREAVAPDIKAMGDALGASIDELRETNSRDHQIVESRLGDLETKVDMLLKHDAERDTAGRRYGPTSEDPTPT